MKILRIINHLIVAITLLAGVALMAGPASSPWEGSVVQTAERLGPYLGAATGNANGGMLDNRQPIKGAAPVVSTAAGWNAIPSHAVNWNGISR